MIASHPIDRLGYDRGTALAYLKSLSLRFGDFTLRSGKKSNYYFDSKPALLNAEALTMLSAGVSELVNEYRPNAVGGLEAGAISIVSGVLLTYRFRASLTTPPNGFYVRKQVKDHGTANRVEGIVNPGDRVVIVDDVLTTGGSALESIAAVNDLGAKVEAVICLVDRLQGAREALAAYEFHSLFTVNDFGIGAKS